jgi:hypothetical protein
MESISGDGRDSAQDRGLRFSYFPECPYLLGLFAATPAAQDPRRQKLIASVLSDFERLSAKT